MQVLQEETSEAEDEAERERNVAPDSGVDHAWENFLVIHLNGVSVNEITWMKAIDGDV